MQVCTSLQTDNHASTPPLSFYRPDALPAAQPTVSKHWRWILCSNIMTEIALVLWTRQWRCLEQSWSRDTIVMWVFSAAVSICYCLAKMRTNSWCIVCTVADVFFSHTMSGLLRCTLRCIRCSSVIATVQLQSVRVRRQCLLFFLLCPLPLGCILE